MSPENDSPSHCLSCSISSHWLFFIHQIPINQLGLHMFVFPSPRPSHAGSVVPDLAHFAP